MFFSILRILHVILLFHVAGVVMLNQYSNKKTITQITSKMKINKSIPQNITQVTSKINMISESTPENITHITSKTKINDSIPQNYTQITRKTKINENNPQNMIKIYPNTTVKDLCKVIRYPLINCTCERFLWFCEKLPKVKNDKKKKVIKVICDPRYRLHDVIHGSISIFASVLGMIGNIFVLVISIRNWKKLSRCHKLIYGLAIPDFAFCLFKFIISVPLLWTCKWWYGAVMCKVSRTVPYLSEVIALGLILIIAIERYIGIVHPLYLGFKTGKIRISMIVNITLGIAVVTPYPIIMQYHPSGLCFEKWPGKYSSLIYSWLNMGLYFIIPVCIISYLYYKIVRTLHTSAKFNKELKTIQRRNNNKRVMLILTFLLLAFVFLTFPNHLVLLIVDHLGGVQNISLDKRIGLEYYGFIPYAFHAAVNPIIYSLVDRTFRKRVRKTFRYQQRKSWSVNTLTSQSSNETYEADESKI